MNFRSIISITQIAIPAVVGALALAGAAIAQTNPQSGPVPSPRPQNTPFSSEWAKPFPQTGGYIYMDPRLQYGNQPLRPHRGGVCPPGRFLDSTTGACY